MTEASKLTLQNDMFDRPLKGLFNNTLPARVLKFFSLPFKIILLIAKFLYLLSFFFTANIKLWAWKEEVWKTFITINETTIMGIMILCRQMEIKNLLG